jgi:hypothetical protein
MQWMRASSRHVGWLTLSVCVVCGVCGLWSLSRDDQRRPALLYAAELKVPEAASVERFDFEQQGIEGWKPVAGRWTIEEMSGAPSGKQVLVQRALGLGALASFRPMFVAYVVLTGLTALLYSRLSSRVELASGEARWTNPFTLPSRGRIFTLAGLFTVDSFGTGLIVQSLASYWFFTRFGLQPGSLADSLKMPALP